jgi:hypothetical protein
MRNTGDWMFVLDDRRRVANDEHAGASSLEERVHEHPPWRSVL